MVWFACHAWQFATLPIIHSVFTLCSSFLHVVSLTLFFLVVDTDHMEISLLKALLSNISSFLSLSSFENINSEPVQKYYQRAEEILKLLKPILNAIVDSEITSDEVLTKAFEGLGLSIEELREQFESWQPLLSKVYFVSYKLYFQFTTLLGNFSSLVAGSTQLTFQLLAYF